MDVGPGLQGEAKEVEGAIGGGDEVGALAGVVLGVDVGTGLDEEPGDFEVVAVGGGDQGGATLRVGGGDAGTLAQEVAGGVGTPRPAAAMRAALRSVWVGMFWLAPAIMVAPSAAAAMVTGEEEDEE
ncbi:MAG: hypothetical protein U0232_19365 [Thermomicrobiales bacterium]